MVMHKVSELEGDALDAAVAMCIWGEMPLADFTPSRSWQHAGWIIVEAMISLVRPGVYGEFFDGDFKSSWQALIDAYDDHDGLDGRIRMTGQTPLVAAMRAYVYDKFGEEVDL